MVTSLQQILARLREPSSAVRDLVNTDFARQAMLTAA